MKRYTAIFLLVAILGAGCTTRVKNYECLPTPDEATVDPTSLWACNRDVMVRAVRGKRYTIREFDEASRFFEGLTGVPASAERTRFGPIPGEDLERDLASWDAWYEDHGDQLFWDGDEVRAGS